MGYQLHSTVKEMEAQKSGGPQCRGLTGLGTDRKFTEPAPPSLDILIWEATHQHGADDWENQINCLGSHRASLVAQLVKNLPAMQETQVRSLGGEDPLEKEMATHSSILSWKIPWTEEPGRLQSMGSQRVGHD